MNVQRKDKLLQSPVSAKADTADPSAPPPRRLSPERIEELARILAACVQLKILKKNGFREH